MKPLRLLHPARSAFTLTLALSCSIASLCHAQTPTGGASSSTDDNTRLRALFRQGVAAFNAGKIQEAAKTLGEAWSIRKTYDVAAALAQAELALKDYRDAAEHLDFGISHFAPVESEQTLEQLKHAFADVKTRVATLKIAVDHDGAEVRVDGRNVGTSPLEVSPFVEPGVHTVVARLGGDQVIQTVNTEAGKEYPVAMKFGAAAQVATSPDSSGPAANYTPVVVTGSVGAAALIAGVVLLLESSYKGTQRDDERSQLPGVNPCGAQNPNASACDKISSLDSDSRTFRTLSFVGFGAAAAAGVATYLLWPRASQQAQLGVRAMVLPSSAGLDVFTGFDGTF